MSDKVGLGGVLAKAAFPERKCEVKGCDAKGDGVAAMMGHHLCYRHMWEFEEWEDYFARRKKAMAEWLTQKAAA